MPSSLLISCVILLIVIVTVESTYPAYAYDDGNGGEEHCCIVRVRGNLCLATPITRSLLQVNRQCSGKSDHEHRQLRLKGQNNKYLDQLTRRLLVQTSQIVDKKVIVELKEPLEKEILENDLICLTSTNSSVNLEKCYIELANDNDTDDDPNIDDDDDDDERKGSRSKARQNKNAIVDEEKTDDEDDDDDDDETDSSDSETRQVEVTEPVRVREGHGLSIRHKFKLNFDDARPTNRQQRQCWSWYHKQVKKAKNKKRCVKLNDHTERCLHQFVFRSSNREAAATTNDTPAVSEPKHSALVVPVGSKLFCENRVGNDKLIGLHRRSRICFGDRNQISVEHLFSDIASLSDIKKNKPILEFLGNNKKYKAEFEDDCHDKKTLVESDEEQEATTAAADDEDQTENE